MFVNFVTRPRKSSPSTRAIEIWEMFRCGNGEFACPRRDGHRLLRTSTSDSLRCGAPIPTTIGIRHGCSVPTIAAPAAAQCRTRALHLTVAAIRIIHNQSITRRHGR